MSGALRTYSRKGGVQAKVLDRATELCRLCLRKPSFSIPIFNVVPEVSPAGACIANRITVCVGLEMPQKSYLPSKICMECHKELELCYQFKKKCETSYQRLVSHSLAVKNMQNKEQINENTSKSNKYKPTIEYNLGDSDKHLKKQPLIAESLDTRNNSLILGSVRKECFSAKNSNAPLKDGNVSNSKTENTAVNSNVTNDHESTKLVNNASKSILSNSNQLINNVISSNMFDNKAVNSNTVRGTSPNNNLNSNHNNSNILETTIMNNDAIDNTDISFDIRENEEMESNIIPNDVENSNALDDLSSNEMEINEIETNEMESNDIESVPMSNNTSKITHMKRNAINDEIGDTYFVNIHNNAMECMVELMHPSRTRQPNTDANRSILKQANMKSEVTYVGESHRIKSEHQATEEQGYQSLPVTENPFQPNLDPDQFEIPTSAFRTLSDPPSSLSTFLTSVLETVGAISRQTGLMQLREDVGELHLMLGDGTQLIMEVEEEEEHTSHEPAPSSRVCSICARSFATCSARARHERGVHARARPHCCPHATCRRAFAQRSTLNRHMLTHQDYHPFQCELCGRGFRQRGGLQVHHQTHHADNKTPRPCPYAHCNKRFLHASGLSRHIKWHEGRLFVCAVCGRVFTDKSALRRHIASDTHNRLAIAKELDELGD